MHTKTKFYHQILSAQYPTIGVTFITDDSSHYSLHPVQEVFPSCSELESESVEVRWWMGFLDFRAGGQFASEFRPIVFSFLLTVIMFKQVFKLTNRLFVLTAIFP